MGSNANYSTTKYMTNDIDNLHIVKNFIKKMESSDCFSVNK